MTQNNNLNILAWYTSLDQQNHRKDYAFGQVYQLITPERKVLPFQIVRTTRANTVTAVNLYKIDGTLVANITASMNASGLSIVRYETDGYDVIVYHGLQILTEATPEGQYYLSLTDGVDTWYSEVYTIVKDLSKYIKIEYWNANSILYTNGQIDYSTETFRFVVYICSQIGKPEYNFEEEAKKVDGYTFVEKQVSEKTYKFTFLAPEYLCDAMRVIRLHDYVRITSENIVYNADTFLTTPRWQEEGNLAAVEAEFETDTIIKKISDAQALGTGYDFTYWNNNLCPLAWYPSIEYQNHRKEYAYGQVYPLITPERRLLPFQLKRATRANAISSFKLYTADGTLFADITTTILATGLSVIRYESLNYDIILYNSALPISTATPEGQYYAVMTDGVDTWYSEVFTIVKDLSRYLLIEYWNADNLPYTNGHIDYTTNYINKIYLDTQIGKPEYNFEEEVKKVDGYTFVEKQISEKTYKFSFVAPEYLCDAVRLIRLHDYIRITSRGIVYNAEIFLATPRWQEDGNLAGVEAEFETDTVIKKIGKDPAGDFNRDFNEDFFTED